MGDRIKLTTNTNLRASANGTILGTQYYDRQGTVVGGPSSAGGYSWLNVDFDSGLDGWVAEIYAVEIAGTTPTPTPTPDPTPTPTPAPTATITASPTSITVGQSATLTWSSTDATSCTGTNFTASGTSGTQSISPTVSLTYGVTCSGAGGTSPAASATVTVSSAPETLTFGNTTTGTVTDSNDSNSLEVSKFTSGAKGGAAQSISVYVANPISPAPNNQYSLAIYADNGDKPGALIAQTAAGTLSGDAWNTLPITATIAANTTYWLGYTTNGTSVGDNNFRMSPGSASQVRWRAKTFNGTWPASYGTVAGSDAFASTIYVTYTNAGEVLGPKAMRLDKTLKKTWVGAEVTYLQNLLKKLGFFNAEPTGYFGNQTAAAVSAFQRAFGLEAVGIVGPKTRALLNNQ